MWSSKAWREYTSYLSVDLRYLKRINKLIKSIQRDGHQKGLGHPEPLKQIAMPHGIEAWFRRITEKDRLVYFVKPPYVKVIACQYHY